MTPNKPTGETMEEGDYSAAEAELATIPEQESVTISADLLGGVPVKSGDKLRFCATSDPDEDGNVQGYFEAAEETEVVTPDPDESYGEDLKTAMSQAERI